MKTTTLSVVDGGASDGVKEAHGGPGPRAGEQNRSCPRRIAALHRRLLGPPVWGEARLGHVCGRDWCGGHSQELQPPIP